MQVVAAFCDTHGVAVALWRFIRIYIYLGTYTHRYNMRYWNTSTYNYFEWPREGDRLLKPPPFIYIYIKRGVVSSCIYISTVQYGIRLVTTIRECHVGTKYLRQLLKPLSVWPLKTTLPSLKRNPERSFAKVPLYNPKENFYQKMLSSD